MEIRIRVTVLVRRDDGRLLFVRHRKNDRVYWLLPGGGQEPGEPMTETARRELEEETGVKIDGCRFLGLRETMDAEAGRHIVFPIFAGLKPDFTGLRVGIDQRVEGYDFFTAEELADRPIYPHMGEDLRRLAADESVESFKTLNWVP